MAWRVRKTTELRPPGGLSGVAAALVLLVAAPVILALLLLISLVVGVSLAYSALRKKLGWAEEPAPAEPPAPVRVWTTPALTVEMVDTDDLPLPPALQELEDAWAEAADEQGGLWLQQLRTSPELPGLHGQLVTSFHYAWGGGAVVAAAAAGTRRAAGNVLAGLRGGSRAELGASRRSELVLAVSPRRRPGESAGGLEPGHR